MERIQRDITQTMRGILVDWLVEVRILSLPEFAILNHLGNACNLLYKTYVFEVYPEAGAFYGLVFKRLLQWLLQSHKSFCPKTERNNYS